MTVDPYRTAAAVVTAFLGLAFLVRFLRGFLGRIYLALLGFAFFALAGSFLVSSPQLHWLQWLLLGLAGIFFLGAAFFALAQTMQQMRLIRERRIGLEREMWEYLEQLKQRAAEKQAQEAAEQPGQQTPADAPEAPREGGGSSASSEGGAEGGGS